MNAIPMTDNRHVVDQLHDVREKIKILKQEEKDCIAAISGIMGANDSLGGDQYIAKQSVTTRKGSIDTKLLSDFLEEHSASTDDFRKPDSSIFSIRLQERVFEV